MWPRRRLRGRPDRPGPLGAARHPAAPNALATGSDGCNDYLAPYVLAGSAISFRAIGVSYPPRTCGPARSAIESAYVTALASVTSYLLVDSTLAFVAHAGTPVLIYRASTRPTIVGGSVVTGLVDPTGTLATPLGSDALTLLFGANELLAGRTGCNWVFGRYAVADSAMVIGPLGVTRAACATEELSAQEARFLGALGAARAWTVEADGLRLFDLLGMPLMTLVRDPHAVPLPTLTPTLSASPSPGPTAKPTPGTVAVPDVVGDVEADALVTLGAAGLTAGERLRAYSDTVDFGQHHQYGPQGGGRGPAGYRCGLHGLPGSQPDTQPEPETHRQAHPQAHRRAHCKADPQAYRRAHCQANPQAHRRAHCQADPQTHRQAQPEPHRDPGSQCLVRRPVGRHRLDVVRIRRWHRRGHRHPDRARDTERGVLSRRHHRFAGCNSYTASYTLEAPSIDIGEVAAAQMVCGDLGTASRPTTWRPLARSRAGCCPTTADTDTVRSGGLPKSHLQPAADLGGRATASPAGYAVAR